MNSLMLLVILCISLVSCSGLLAYYMYQLLVLDAKSRGLARPKLWAIIGAGGGRGEGLLFYLFKRKNFSGEMTEKDQQKSRQLKKRMNLLLIVQVVSALLFVFWLVNQK